MKFGSLGSGILRGRAGASFIKGIRARKRQAQGVPQRAPFAQVTMPSLAFSEEEKPCRM